MNTTPEARIITGTVIATPTTRTMTVTVTEGDTVTNYTDDWEGISLGSATGLAHTARTTTRLMWGFETEWMLVSKDADKIVLEILDEDAVGEEEHFDDSDAWVMENPADWSSEGEDDE